MTRRLVVAALLAAVLAGCRLDLGVDVALERDGSGMVEVVVTVDQDGIDRLGGDLAAVLVTDDLEEAGWTVDGPAVDDDGNTVVRFQHHFAEPGEAGEVLAAIAGGSGPFQDFAVGRQTSFARTRWTFTGRIDFSGGVEAFGDPALTALLDGEPLGQSVDDIEAQLGQPLSEVIGVRVSVDLPRAPVEEWRVPFGEGPVDLSATGTERRTATLVAAGVAAACATVLLVYGVVRLARRARSPRAGA